MEDDSQTESLDSEADKPPFEADAENEEDESVSEYIPSPGEFDDREETDPENGSDPVSEPDEEEGPESAVEAATLITDLLAGPTARKLEEHGITLFSHLLTRSSEEIAALSGIGPKRQEEIRSLLRVRRQSSSYDP